MCRSLLQSRVEDDAAPGTARRFLDSCRNPPPAAADKIIPAHRRKRATSPSRAQSRSRHRHRNLRTKRPAHADPTQQELAAQPLACLEAKTDRLMICDAVAETFLLPP